MDRFYNWQVSFKDGTTTRVDNAKAVTIEEGLVHFIDGHDSLIMAAPISSITFAKRL